MPTPHKHAEIIKKWADGHKIQIKVGEEWLDIDFDAPTFTSDYYRVKPEPTILHGFIDANTLTLVDQPYTVFRLTQNSVNNTPCTLTFFPDA